MIKEDKEMRYRMIKSRRQFLQNVALGGVALALTRVLKAGGNDSAQGVSLPGPIQTSLMPQPNVPMIWNVAFSPLTSRMAVSAGSDDDQLSLYVNSLDAPENFQIYWSPDTEVYGVSSLAWSHNEKALAFIGMSGSKTTKIGEVCLYVLDIASGNVRKVLKIIEADSSGERRIVNIHQEKTQLAWFGDKKICARARDESIIAVDCDDGHIDTLVPKQDHKIRGGLVSVSPNKLRFLKKSPSGQGWEIEICEFNGSEVISCGTIPLSSENTLEWLSADGKYIFICVKEKPETIIADKTVIFDLSQWASVKEIPLTVKSNSETYIYIPFTVLEGKQLVLFEMKHQIGKPSRQRRLVTTKL